MIVVFRYPTGTKLTGTVLVHKVGSDLGPPYEVILKKLEELCADSTLKNLVIMIHQFDEVTHDQAEEQLQSDLSNPNGLVQAVVRRGARIYRCTSASEPDLGALRIILENLSVAELRRELEEQKKRAEQEADEFKKRIAEMQSEEESTRKEMVRVHSQELEEQKRMAQEGVADVFKKHTAEMQLKEESIRQEVSQELEEQKRKAQEEADGLRECIAELQSELGEDRRHASGKVSATYNLRPVPADLRVFLAGSLT